MDVEWWGVYRAQVVREFRGRLWSTNRVPGVERVHCLNPGNSGAAAVAAASHFGAKRVILVGYDCKLGPGGEAHHHGDHPKGLGNAGSLPKWFSQFEFLANKLPKSVQVVNCTPDSALDMFPIIDLEVACATDIT